MSDKDYYIAAGLAWAGCNLIAFALMGWDKFRARRKLCRIPERRLKLIALLGGGPGVAAAMLFFRHKTRHVRFGAAILSIVILQLVALGLYAWSRFV